MPGFVASSWARPEQAARLRRQGRVHGDDVGPMQQLRQPDQLRTGLRSLILGEVRVAGDHAHLEAGRAARHRLADLAEADDPERLAAQLPTGIRGAIPLALPDRGVRRSHVTKQSEHEGHGVLGGGDRVARRGVDDHHAGARRRVDVDAIDPDARHSDDAHAWRRSGKQLAIDAGLGSDDEGIPVPHRRRGA